MDSFANSEKIIAAKSPQLIVTEKFLEYLVVFLGKYSKDDMLDFKAIIIDEGISDVQQSSNQALITWASSGFSQVKLPDDITEEECSNIAHKLYLLICEIVGPVEADKIINCSIDESLKSEAASRFNPRNLL